MCIAVCVYCSVWCVLCVVVCIAVCVYCLWQVFELLKAAVMRSLKDEQMQSGSMFVQGLLPQSRGVTHMILDTVRNRSAHRPLATGPFLGTAQMYRSDVSRTFCLCSVLAGTMSLRVWCSWDSSSWTCSDPSQGLSASLQRARRAWPRPPTSRHVNWDDSFSWRASRYYKSSESLRVQKLNSAILNTHSTHGTLFMRKQHLLNVSVILEPFCFCSCTSQSEVRFWSRS